MSNQLVTIPFHGDGIRAAMVNGTPHVALRPTCESLGLDFSAQLQRLKRQPWAVVVMTPTTGADGKTYDMTMIDRRTFTMWLATIDTGRLRNDTTRKLVIAYQNEAADALDRYFHEGGAIRVTDTDSDADILARAVIVAQRTIAERDERIRRQGERLAETEPKARILDDLTNTDGLLSVADTAKQLSNQSTVKVGRDRLFAILREWGWVYRDNGHWSAMQRQVDAGHLVMKTHRTLGEHRNGSRFAYAPTVMVTRSGLVTLMRKWAQWRFEHAAQLELEAGA